MIVWKRDNIFKLLCLFGDFKEHSWLETINIGTRLFLDIKIIGDKYKYHTDKFEDFFKKAVNYGIIDKIETSYLRQVRLQREYQIQPEDYNYKLSAKGDKILRQEQAERTGDGFYYNLFDRSVEGEFGVDRFAPLTPTNLNVKNKQTYKVRDLKRERRPKR